MNAVVLGSAFSQALVGGVPLVPMSVSTPYGEAQLHQWGDHIVLLRHGAPHRYLPHQIPFRANAWALWEVGVEAVLLTSSVGVMDADVPLFTPLLIGDLVMLENRLPSGGPCTMWPMPTPGQGHLVLEGGLFDKALSAQVSAMLGARGMAPPPPVTFGFQSGPRTKTGAENRVLVDLGVQVNSMSIGPEVVLLNELEVPVTAVGIGHKRSGETGAVPQGSDWVKQSLGQAREATEALAVAFLEEATPVPFANRVVRL